MTDRDTKKSSFFSADAAVQPAEFEDDPEACAGTESNRRRAEVVKPRLPFHVLDLFLNPDILDQLASWRAEGMKRSVWELYEQRCSPARPPKGD